MTRRALLLLPLALSLLHAGSRPAFADKLRVAVLEFGAAGATGELDSLGKGLQSMITTDLAQVDALQLVERARLQEIQAEIKLGRTDLVDKATASKIGRLAGASHLLSGTFTVAGAQMRLDARLFAVESGQVVLAEKIEGERDAFFELEKALVGKLIGAVGVKLQPKERAEVARIHTADFEAFRRFSQGVQLFDEKKYDAALAALRDAGKRDANFKLAAVTLDQYEHLIADLRTKADALENASAQLERLKQDKQIADVAQMVEKLYAIAARSGAAAQPERLAALCALALIYGTSDGPGHHEKLRRVQDEFAMQRTAETLWKSYVAESLSAFPLVPLDVNVNVDPSLPRPATFEADWKSFVERVTNYSAGSFNHQESLANSSLNKASEIARRLLLDRHQEAELRAQIVLLHSRLTIPTTDLLYERRYELATNWREIGEIAKSTQLFSSLAAGQKEPYKLKDLANQLETNRDLEKALAKAPLRKILHEILFGGRAWNDDALLETRKQMQTIDAPTPWVLHRLSGARTIGDENGLVVDGAPVWKVRGGSETLQTGPRTDPLRGTELRYHRGAQGADALLVVDGVLRKDVAARFAVSFAPPADWWPRDVNPGSPTWPGRMTSIAQAKVDTRRPEVAFCFGVRDINAEKRPLRSLQLVVAQDGVRLVEAVQADAGAPAVLKILDEKKVDLKGTPQIEVSVSVGGDSVKAQVAGKSYTFNAPADRTGFYGLQLRGPGFARVSGLKITTKAK